MTTAPKTGTNDQIVRMLVTVSTVFIAFKLPNVIRRSVWNDKMENYKGDVTLYISALQRLTTSLSEYLDGCNYAFNTYFYILSVKKFRQDVRNLCCHGKGTHKPELDRG
jgi:hypothetical protein